MLCQDSRTMRPFSERLREAAAHAGVPYKPTAIGKSIGVSKQTVHEWMAKGRMPDSGALAAIAAAWKVDINWLAAEQGSMVPEPPADLSKEERYILKSYRVAEPKAQRMFLLLLKAIGKAMVVVALVMQLSPRPAEAMQHNNNCQSATTPLFNQFKDVIRIVGGWCTALMERLLKLTFHERFRAV